MIEDKKISPIAFELRELSQLAQKKYETYGNTYELEGEIMNLLFPEGLTLNSKEAHSYYGILTWIIGKLCRCAHSKDPYAIIDSLRDMAVYSTMAAVVYQKGHQNITGGNDGN